MNEPIYEKEVNSLTTVIKRINADETVTWIPVDPANSDYQLYLKSLES